jgi:excisionase family DNA binding protein
MDRLISIEKAADVLGVSPWTIRAWITQGKLGSAKLGSRRLLPESEIQKLIADARVPALVELRNPAKLPAESVK